MINTSKFNSEQINQLQQGLIDDPIGLVDVSGSQSAGYTLAMLILIKFARFIIG